MAERPKLLYIILSDDDNVVDGGAHPHKAGGRNLPPPRYTRPVLQSTLQLMGCKPRHALKISDSVFDVLRSEMPVRKAIAKENSLRRHHSEPASEALLHLCEVIDKQQADPDSATADWREVDGVQGNKVSKPTKKRASVTVSREKFLDVVCDKLAQYQYVGPNQRADLMLACKVREKKTSVTVLLCGTSGCGKSTLSSLLASRLGITTVVSTDSVRHMMRSFVSEKENPLLWASTYHAGECLDPVAIAEAKAKKKEARTTSIHPRSSGGLSGLAHGSPGASSFIQDTKNKTVVEERSNALPSEKGNTEGVSNETTCNDGSDTLVGSKTLAVQGFKAQSEMVIDSLDRLITSWEAKNESVVVEGVHLSLNFVMGLMKKHPSIVPFMVYISNEDKHLERFAVRAKYMTLDPAKNKYVKYIRNIRTIQEYLCKRADKHLVPKVNNTNVDKSIALIHATIFSTLRRREGGEPPYDQATNTVKVVDQEYRSQYAASSLGSKVMFQLIQRRGSSRHLMALMNDDGSVAKAWPIESDVSGKQASSNGHDSGVRTPLYGPLAVGKVEPVNLQFGNFGLSAWLTDTGAASYAASHNSSADGHSSRGDGEVIASRPASTCSSSPRHGDGADKELTEEVTVLGSDEEADDEEPDREIDSDGEASESERENVDGDEEGSVDDQSIRSDEDAADDYAGGEQLDDVFWSEDLDDGESRHDISGDDEGLAKSGGAVGRPHSRVPSFPKVSSVRRIPSFHMQRSNDGPNTEDTPGSPVVDSRSHNRSKSFPNWEFAFFGEGCLSFPRPEARLGSVLSGK